MEAYSYDAYGELYWKDVRFRLAKLYILRSPEAAEPEDTASAHGWTAVFGREGELYSGITYYHRDGAIVQSFIPAPSSTPYVLTFSPDGSRAAVEYTNAQGIAGFYVQALNGDKLMNDLYDYNEYLNRYYGEYKAGSLEWADNDNIEGINEFGRFRFNIYEFQVTQLDDSPALTDPNNKNTVTIFPDVPHYTVSMDIPEIWREQGTYYDLARRAQGMETTRMTLPSGIPRSNLLGETGGWKPENLAGTGWLNKETEISHGVNGNGVTYLVLGEIHDSEIGHRQYTVVFAFDGEVLLDAQLTTYPEDGENDFDAVVLPIIDSVKIQRTVTVVEIEKDVFIGKIAEMGEAGIFPPYSYTIKVNGFGSPVYLDMAAYDHPAFITAMGKRISVSESVHLYGNCGVDLFEVPGAVIFSWDYYGVGYTYIIGEDFTQTLQPGAYTSVKLYLDENGVFRYKRVNNHIADITQTGGLCVATGYDDFLYCIGSASIADGKLVLGDAEEYHTIGDKYDLDQEFAQGGYSRYHQSIEEVFEMNRHLPNATQRRTSALGRLLSLTVGELRTTYGTLTMEYSEHGPGQPVYSMESLPGVLLVFHAWNMDDPLTDDMFPAELVITEDYGRPVQGLSVGEAVENGIETIDWADAQYDLINGTVHLLAQDEQYTLTTVIGGPFANLPDEMTSDESDWLHWAEEYLSNPTGAILHIRMALR